MRHALVAATLVALGITLSAYAAGLTVVRIAAGLP